MHETGHKLKLGIIGSSLGNGHPYSWSSIINGYNISYLEKCPYEVIINYLKQEKLQKEMKRLRMPLTNYKNLIKQT